MKQSRFIPKTLHKAMPDIAEDLAEVIVPALRGVRPRDGVRQVEYYDPGETSIDWCRVSIEHGKHSGEEDIRVYVANYFGAQSVHLGQEASHYANGDKTIAANLRSITNLIINIVEQGEKVELVSS